MVLHMPLTIPIFFDTETSEQLMLRGVEYSILELDIEDVTFYELNAVGPYFDKKSGQTLTMIYANGQDFITPLPRTEVEELISTHR